MGNQPTYDELMQQIEALEEELKHQRQAYDEQTQTQSLLFSLIDSLPLNVFSKDKKGRFILANRQYCQTVGKSTEEILGCTDDDFHPPEMARKYRLDDRAVMDSRQVVALEEEHRTTGGTAMDVSVIKAPLYNRQREVTGVLGVFWDISQRKQTEQVWLEGVIRQKCQELHIDTNGPEYQAAYATARHAVEGKDTYAKTGQSAPVAYTQQRPQALRESP